ncbi:MAG: type I secretion system permease/ATPase [Desulfobacteraceae bacterium]|nr:type I secretion system permease/ATPase [Desulfobacteraceae bacterium]
MNEFLKKWKKYFIFAAVLSCFINILQLTFTFYMFSIYGQIVTSYSELSLYSITIIALYALVVLGLFNYLRTRLLNVAGLDLNKKFGDAVLKNMLKLHAYPAARGYAQGLNDLNLIMNFFNSPGLAAILDAPWAPFYLLLIVFVSPVLGLCATMGAVVILGLGILQNLFTRNRLAKANNLYGQNLNEVNVLIRNAEVINSMGMEKGICNRWDDQNESVITHQTIASRHAGIVQSITKPLQIFMQVVIYGIGGYLAMIGELDTGLMIVASIIMGQALGPVTRTMATWSHILKVKSAYARLSQFLNFISNQPKKMTLPVPMGHIKVENLFFKLGQKVLLKNISFSLLPGEILGVIGPSGAGKTTLCKLLVGIWPAFRGKVRLDDVDIFYWDHEELGRHLGYLPQEIELFNVSVATNIARMGEIDPDNDQDKIETAAKTVNIHEFIESLPQGYETPLYAENGVSPSGGQKQRIGLARALYGQPKIIVLDEPNSNLDEIGEKELIKTISLLKKERSITGIIVTHKPEILSVVDKILLLKEGQVVDFGDKDEILNKISQPNAPRKQAI